MRIKYKIFWVEDDNSWFKTNKDLFEDTLEDWGFKLDYERAKSFEEVEEIIGKGGLKEFDLMLIDLKLNNNEDEYGNRIIDLIRGQDILTDIIFYSSAYDRIHEIMRTNELEGVYTSSRTGLETKFEKVVKTTIKKVQEVNNIRGLLMAETSDLDVLMLDIINKALNSDKKDAIEKYAIEKIKETITNNENRCNSAETTITEKINDGRIFTSFHKAKVINKICKINDLEINSFFENYNNKILYTRNVFAHVKEEILEGKRVLVSKVSGKKEIFNDDRCIQIRKHLIEYRDILKDINEKI